MNTGKTTCPETIPERSTGVDRGILIMIASVVCFTANALLLKYLGTDRAIGPSVAMLFRALVGAFVVLTFFRGRRKLEITPIFTDRRLIYRGITGILGTAAFYATVPTLGAGKATILGNTYVLFAVIIAAVAIGETLNRARLFWMAVAFAGIVLLVGKSDGGSSLRTPLLHEGIALGGAVFAAITVVLIRSLTERFSNGTIFMTQCIWIGIAVLPFAIGSLKTLNGVDIFLLTAAGVAAAFGQLLLNEGFRRLSVAMGASIQMALPLLTAAGGFLIFGEFFTNLQILGSLLILGGIFQVRKSG